MKPASRLLSVLLTFFALIRLQGADPSGPIKTPGITPLVDSNGVQAVGFRFTPPSAKEGSWKGKWIWIADPNVRAGWFRKEINLKEDPRHVTAYLTADRFYRLWVNGKLVSRGPVDMGPAWGGKQPSPWLYDVRDLTGAFHAGKNIIAAEVRNGRPGFLFEADLDGTTIASDTSWKTTSAQERASGWQALTFDDAAWKQAREVPDVWSPLVPSEIPPLLEAVIPSKEIKGLPTNRILSTNGSFTVLMDRAYSGYPRLTVKGGDGAIVRIKTGRGGTFHLGGGTEVLESPLIDAISPFFTVEATNITKPLEIIDAGVTFSAQPVEYRGTFECNDPELNHIWQASRWAVQICQLSWHVDSPIRQEPLMDAGDYVIQSMVNYNAFAQPWLARQDIRKYARSLKMQGYQEFHTSYSIAWLQMLMEYYRHTGDKALINEMAPYVHELMGRFAGWKGANGLISEAPSYMFMDWVTIGGFACHHPPAVIGQGYLTALYYAGLGMASQVSEIMGDKEHAEHYGKLRAETKEAFNRELWVPEKGLYRDGKPFQSHVKPSRWLPVDKNIETFSPHVNLLAVLYDLAPRDKQVSIMEKVEAEQPLNIQPWFMHWTFDALDHAGIFGKHGTRELRRWKVLPETGTFREMWNGGDTAHGWCSTPLVQLSSKVLGISPIEPGFAKISIRPQPCDLTWARGKVPTPYGDVEVSWKIEGSKFTLETMIPPGTTARIELPGRESHLKDEADDAHSPTQPGMKEGSTFFEVSPGRHAFSSDLKSQ
jgi:hypothetical protein